MDDHISVFQKVVNDDSQAYESLFKEYYKFLCSYAYGLTKDRHVAEELVEDFFVNLWHNRHKINISTSVRSYFVSSVHNRCINYLQRERPKFISSSDIEKLIDHEKTVGDKLITPEVPTLLTTELEKILFKAIENLPKSCKEIFLLSRYQDLSYAEIADKQNISVNTVKTQIKIALSKLKDDLKDFIIVFLIVFINKF